MGEEARFVARYASVYVRGESFQEVGDVLAERGFDMVRAAQTDRGVLVIPHKEENRQSAHLFAMLDSVEVAEKPDDCNHNGAATLAQYRKELDDGLRARRNGHTVEQAKPAWSTPDDEPMSVQVAAAHLAGAEVEAGAVEPIPLTCGECGAVHPEGVVCLVPIFYERRCCIVETYAHDGPHEAATDDGLITHRWIEELVVTDLPFDSYLGKGRPGGAVMTEAQLLLINRDIVKFVGWDAQGRPVVKFTVTDDDGPPLAVNPDGEPDVPVEPIRMLDDSEAG